MRERGSAAHIKLWDNIGDGYLTAKRLGGLSLASSKIKKPEKQINKEKEDGQFLTYL